MKYKFENITNYCFNCKIIYVDVQIMLLLQIKFKTNTLRDVLFKSQLSDFYYLPTHVES